MAETEPNTKDNQAFSIPLSLVPPGATVHSTEQGPAVAFSDAFVPRDLVKTNPAFWEPYYAEVDSYLRARFSDRAQELGQEDWQNFATSYTSYLCLEWSMLHFMITSQHEMAQSGNLAGVEAMNRPGGFSFPNEFERLTVKSYFLWALEKIVPV